MSLELDPARSHPLPEFQATVLDASDRFGICAASRGRPHCTVNSEPGSPETATTTRSPHCEVTRGE